MNLFILDKNFITVGILDDYISLIWTDRYQKSGDFELVLSTNGMIPDNIQQDYYLQSSSSEHIMIIEKFVIKSDIEEGSTITISGRSLESILDRRIIWGLKTISGNFQNGIKTLLDDCIISPTDSDRKIDNFIFEETDDTMITQLAIDAQYTGDNLYDVVCNLCADRGIGFKVTLNDEKQFVFKLYSGVDRSYNQSKNPWVIFSPKFDNIISSNYLETRSGLKNVTLVGGEGEGSDRKYTSIGNTTGLDRREMFTDAGDISSNLDDGKTMSTDEYTSLLLQRGKENLAENTEVVAFEGEAETSQMFKYGEDFFNGDIVQIANEYGHETSARVIEIVTSEDENGTSIYPTFSADSSETLPKGYMRLPYIQSSGTQYIDTGFKPNQDTRVLIDFGPPDDGYVNGTLQILFGARASTAANSFTFFLRYDANNNTTSRDDYGSISVHAYNTKVPVPVGRVLIDKNKNKFSYGSNFYSYTLQTFSAGYTMFLFAGNTGGKMQYPCSVKLYSCQIYSNDILVREFIPAKNDKGDIGLYDFVERKFYKNAGSGDFITNL